MKRVLLTLIATCFLVLTLPAAGLAREAQPEGKPDRALKKGDWELRIFYRAKGSKSEGQHGVLLFKGKEIPPGKRGDEKKTTFGIMTYYGNTYELPWETTGWNFKDKSKILRSLHKKHATEQPPSGDSQNHDVGASFGTP